MPILKIMDGTLIELTAEAAAEIGAQLGKGCEFIAVKGALINVKSISGIYPDDIVEKESPYGRLHDGSRVVKRFGRWTDAENPDVNIDASYYPEVARDQVMGEGTYLMKIEPLPPELRRGRYAELMAGLGTRLEAPRTGGLERIGGV